MSTNNFIKRLTMLLKIVRFGIPKSNKPLKGGILNTIQSTMNTYAKIRMCRIDKIGESIIWSSKLFKVH